MKNNKAFTLIELLVVVLIIGILASVALPQYEKSVRKARIAEAKTLLRAIADAGEVYCLANGCTMVTPLMDDFDIEVPTQTKNWNVWLEEADQGGMWYNAEPRFETGYFISYADHKYGGGNDSNYNGRFICDDLGTDLGKKVCASLGKKFETNYYHID